MINLYRFNEHSWPYNTYWLVLSEDVMIFTHTIEGWYYIRDTPDAHINKINPSSQTLRELL